jgi:hypothetical protein
MSKEDTARLDWIQQRAKEILYDDGELLQSITAFGGKSWREAIDRARTAQPSESPSSSTQVSGPDQREKK